MCVRVRVVLVSKWEKESKFAIFFGSIRQKLACFMCYKKYVCVCV